MSAAEEDLEDDFEEESLYYETSLEELDRLLELIVTHLNQVDDPIGTCTALVKLLGIDTAPGSKAIKPL